MSKKTRQINLTVAEKVNLTRRILAKSMQLQRETPTLTVRAADILASRSIWDEDNPGMVGAVHVTLDQDGEPRPIKITAATHEVIKAIGKRDGKSQSLVVTEAFLNLQRNEPVEYKRIANPPAINMLGTDKLVNAWSKGKKYIYCKLRQPSRFKSGSMRVIQLAGGEHVLAETGLLKPEYAIDGKPELLVMTQAIFPQAKWDLKTSKAWIASHDKMKGVTGRRVSASVSDEIDKDFDKEKPEGK